MSCRTKHPLGILELERFIANTLNRWNAISQDLDELHAVLFFGVQPRTTPTSPGAVRCAAGRQTRDPKPDPMGEDRVTYQYSLEPLSYAGGLRDFGGRFNAGAELDDGTLKPWLALYIAENLDTAFREKFQLAKTDSVGGLTPQELAFEHGVSHTTIFVKGKLHSVFDMTSLCSLEAVAQALRRIKIRNALGSSRSSWRFQLAP